jgi:protein-tyrosine phosphatase
VIDLHCHILPGIDDGPGTIDESLAIARAAAADGTRTIVATSHVSWRYPNDADTIHTLCAQLNEHLRERGVPVEIRTGAEIAMTRAGELDAEQLSRMRLGGGPWLLLEPPFTPIVTGLDGVVADLHAQGHRVVLAHPERCPAFHRDPDMLEALVAAGVLASVTAGSLTGRFGAEVKRCAERMVERELVHNVASDAHDPQRRPPSLASELQRAGLAELGQWLACSVPAAILSGDPIPARPAIERARGEERQHSRKWWRRG